MAINIKLTDLIYPYFVTNGKDKQEEIKSFSGIYRFSVDRLLGDITRARDLGLNKFLLFGIPGRKDNLGESAFADDSPVVLAIRKIKNKFPNAVIFTDVCLCAYTKHGHCRILKSKSNCFDEKMTLETLARIALAYARAGADWVAPSAMAKNQVAAIRRLLDGNGFKQVKILGYSAKFNSYFYGPFRNAANSSPKFGDRSSYQLNYENSQPALDKIKEDIEAGANAVMVKPALAYLDIIYRAKEKYKFPLVAYNVSGEYALIKYGAAQGLGNEQKMVKEILSSIKRAGSDLIITYHAKDLAKWLKKQ